MAYSLHHTTAYLTYHDMLHNLNYFNIPTRLRYHEIENIDSSKVPLIKLILYILLIIFLLITITNSNLINPRPVSPAKELNILHQNVQGLIPFTEFNKNHLRLDNTKISEIHAFIHDKKTGHNCI